MSICINLFLLVQISIKCLNHNQWKQEFYTDQVRLMNVTVLCDALLLIISQLELVQDYDYDDKMIIECFKVVDISQVLVGMYRNGIIASHMPITYFFIMEVIFLY